MEPTKKIKVLAMDEDGDLKMTLIEVPKSDERPEHHGPIKDEGMRAGTLP